MTEVNIRVALPDDAAGLLAIYAPYVADTAISFECEVPGEDEFRRRIERTLARYPYLVAESGGELWGYAYTGPFVGRAAYGWAAEVSIYLRQDRRRSGLGRRLYQSIEAISRRQNILNLEACIGSPDADDEYLNGNSIAFHSRMGYRMVGEFAKCGRKFGRWYNMVWMEKLLGEHNDAQPAVRPFAGLTEEELAACGVAAAK